jgi:hypothetical protein
VDAAFEVRFLEKLQRLLAEGDFTATYKFAVLIGLAELSVEESLPGDRPFPTRQLTERVVALYWPQVRPVPQEGRVRVLRQNTGQPARIVSLVARLRDEGEKATFLDEVRHARPGAYEETVRDVKWRLVEMPLPRLQRFPSGPDDFLYRIGWTVHDVGRLEREVRRYQRGEPSAFDNRIQMLPGVISTLGRLHGLVRQLVEARWISMVRELNGEMFDDPVDLYEHLFGPQRAALGRLQVRLREIQEGCCFYCASRPRNAAVDHFLPWARFPDDRIENLVLSCPGCNSSKSDHLAAVAHVENWLRRFTGPRYRDLTAISEQLRWPRGGQRTLAVAKHAYGRQPETAPLWIAGWRLEAGWKRDAVERRIDEVARLLRAT